MKMVHLVRDDGQGAEKRRAPKREGSRRELDEIMDDSDERAESGGESISGGPDNRNQEEPQQREHQTIDH